MDVRDIVVLALGALAVGCVDDGSGGSPGDNGSLAAPGDGTQPPNSATPGTDTSGTPGASGVSGASGSGGGPTGTDGGTPAGDSGAPPRDSGAPADTGAPPTETPAGSYVMTWYSFQDNTPVNSAISGSGRTLIPYVSVAVPFRLLDTYGGKLRYGDRLYVDFLHGRLMPNGKKHTGWVEIDDYCGDNGDDSYCFVTTGGKKYSILDLYIGDFSRSGMSTTNCTGPAGSGQELTPVSSGDPGSLWVADYGGVRLGPGKCGDLAAAKAAHGSCWDYTPPASSVSICAYCTTVECTSW